MINLKRVCSRRSAGSGVMEKREEEKKRRKKERSSEWRGFGLLYRGRNAENGNNKEQQPRERKPLVFACASFRLSSTNLKTLLCYFHFLLEGHPIMLPTPYI